MNKPVHRADIDACELLVFMLSAEGLSLGPEVLVNVLAGLEPRLDLVLAVDSKVAAPPLPYLYPH